MMNKINSLSLLMKNKAISLNLNLILLLKIIARSRHKVLLKINFQVNKYSNKMITIQTKKIMKN